MFPASTPAKNDKKPYSEVVSLYPGEQTHRGIQELSFLECLTLPVYHILFAPHPQQLSEPCSIGFTYEASRNIAPCMQGLEQSKQHAIGPRMG